MEWSSVQQLVFLLKSVVLGCCIGCIFDISGGFWRGKQYRQKMYIADALCCVLAAIMTFFGALIICDGQLHPVLFVGILLGILAEHFIIGRWLSLLFYKLHRIVSSILSKMKAISKRWEGLFTSSSLVVPLKGRKWLKIMKKTEKI